MVAAPLPSLPDGRAARGHAVGPQGGSIPLEGEVDAGVTYTAVADVVQPTPEELRAEQIAATGRGPLCGDARDLPEEIEAKALEWTEGTSRITTRSSRSSSGSPIRTASSATTTTSRLVERPGHGRVPDETKAGFCQQFSSAMAMMLRSIGHPRAPGRRLHPRSSPAGLGRSPPVTTENAHSWVEVLFPSYGWLAFEPTPEPAEHRRLPATSTPTPPSRAGAEGAACGPRDAADPPPRQRPEQSGAGDGRGPRAARGPGVSETAVIGAALRRHGKRGRPACSPVATPSSPGGVQPRSWLALVPPARAGAAGAATPRGLGAEGPDPRHLRRVRGPRRRAGAPPDARPDPRGVSAGRPSSGASSNGDLDELTRIATDAAYASRSPAPTTPTRRRRASHAVVRAMRHRAGWTQRLTGPYRRR